MFFLWRHWYPCFGLLVMSALGFKVRVDPSLACLLTAMDSSDSPVVWQLLTSWWPALQLSLFDPHVCKHWWESNPRPSVPLHNCIQESPYHMFWTQYTSLALAELCQHFCDQMNVSQMYPRSIYLNKLILSIPLKNLQVSVWVTLLSMHSSWGTLTNPDIFTLTTSSCAPSDSSQCLVSLISGPKAPYKCSMFNLFQCAWSGQEAAPDMEVPFSNGCQLIFCQL